MTPENIARLPKWAQQEVRTLMSIIRQLREDVTLLSGKAGGDRVSTDDLPLGNNAAVLFRLADDWHQAIRVRIDNVYGRDHLYVSGLTGIAVHPEAGNVVRIFTR